MYGGGRQADREVARQADRLTDGWTGWTDRHIDR